MFDIFKNKMKKTKFGIALRDGFPYELSVLSLKETNDYIYNSIKKDKVFFADV